MNDGNHGLAVVAPVTWTSADGSAEVTRARARVPRTTLADQLRAGDQDALAALFQRHLDAIYNYCYRRTGSWTAAEDLTSTTFLELWRHRRRAVEVDGSLLPWLYGIATNVCRNHLRSQRRGTAAVHRLGLVDVPGVDEEVVDRLDAGDRLRRALGRLAELPARDQDVFALVCWEELSYEQAAAALRIPVGTVRSRLARVRAALRLSDTAPTSDSKE